MEENSNKKDFEERKISLTGYFVVLGALFIFLIYAICCIVFQTNFGYVKGQEAISMGKNLISFALLGIGIILFDLFRKIRNKVKSPSLIKKDPRSDQYPQESKKCEIENDNWITKEYLYHYLFGIFRFIPRFLGENIRFVDLIKSEGGQILKAGEVGFFVKSPFDSLKGYPQYWYYNVKYGDREGVWYVLTSAGQNEEWVWKDKYGLETLPVQRLNNARVDNSASSIGGSLFKYSILVMIMFILALILHNAIK